MILPHRTTDPHATTLVLVGAGRNANYLIGLFDSVGIQIAAVLDDFPKQDVLGHRVTSIDQYAGPQWASVLTIVDPDVRRTIVTRPSLKACVWTSYADPRAVVSPQTSFGEGAFVSPFVVCANATLGRHVFVMPNSVIGPKAQIGDYSCVLPNSTIGSEAEVGSGSTVGMGARIAAGVRIGKDCRIAPNTYVRKDLPDNSLATSDGARVRVMTRSPRRDDMANNVDP